MCSITSILDTMYYMLAVVLVVVVVVANSVDN